MNIGVDVDGVLVDMEGYQLRTGTEYFKKKYGKDVVDPKGYDIEDIFDCTHKEREKFWLKYIWAYCLKEPIFPYAAETLTKLHEKGHNIVIITSRAHTTEKGLTGWVFRKMLLRWLKKNGVYYDKIVYCTEKNSGEDKRRVCLEENIDVMIDDKPENLNAIMDNLKVMCYPAVWNEDIDEKRYIRVNDWSEIYNVIDSVNNG